MDPYTEGALAHSELGKKELERRVTLHGDSGYTFLDVKENTTTVAVSVPPDGVKVRYEDLSVRN